MNYLRFFNGTNGKSREKKEGKGDMAQRERNADQQF